MLRSSIIVQLLTLGLVAGGPLNLNDTKNNGIDEIMDASMEYMKHIITSQMDHPEFDVEDLKLRMLISFMDFLEMIPGNKSEGAVGDAQSEVGKELVKFDKEELIKYTEDILEFFQRLMTRIFKNQMKNPDFKIQDVHDTLTKTFNNFFDMVSLYVNERPKMRALDDPVERSGGRVKLNDPVEFLFVVFKVVAGATVEILYTVAVPFFNEFETAMKEHFVQLLNAMVKYSGNKLYYITFELIRILLDWGNPDNPKAHLYNGVAQYVQDEMETEEQETLKEFMDVFLNLSGNLVTVLSGVVKTLNDHPFARKS